jgi:hypothetical protein
MALDGVIALVVLRYTRDRYRSHERASEARPAETCRQRLPQACSINGQPAVMRAVVET